MKLTFREKLRRQTRVLSILKEIYGFTDEMLNQVSQAMGELIFQSVSLGYDAYAIANELQFQVEELEAQRS